MANPDQKTILIDNAYEEIKNICINLQNDADASNSEVKRLLKLIMNEWEEKQEQKTSFGKDSVIGNLSMNGSIGLGIGINPKTFTWVTLHVCEEIEKVP